MPLKHSSAKSPSRTNFPPQFQKLINHLPLCRPQRPQQSFIHFSQRLLKFFQEPSQRLLVRIESPRQSSRKRSRRQQSPHPLPPAKHILQRQRILLHQIRHMRLYQSKSTPWQNRRHARAKFAINHLHLRHVSYFGRPAYISRRRQQRILHNRPQQNIRRKNLGRFLNQSKNFLAAKCFAGLHSHHKLSAAQTDRLPPLIHIHEKQRSLARNFHLRVKPGLVQRLSARQQLVPKRFRIFDRLPENGRRNPVQAAIQRIEQNHSATRKQSCKQFSERRSKRFANCIRFPQRSLDVHCKRTNQRPRR